MKMIEKNCCGLERLCYLSGVGKAAAYHTDPPHNMKNTLELNVGLDSARLGHIPAETAQGLLALLGFTVHASREVVGEWEGKPESTLALLVSPPCECAAPSCREMIRAKIQAASRQLGQECIAIRWPEGQGELVPPCAYAFNPELFHSPTVPAARPITPLA